MTGVMLPLTLVWTSPVKVCAAPASPRHPASVTHALMLLLSCELQTPVPKALRILCKVKLSRTREQAHRRLLGGSARDYGGPSLLSSFCFLCEPGSLFPTHPTGEAGR